MRLSELLKNIEVKSVEGSLDVEITDVCIDSRQVKPGALFVAIRGTQTDGHQYIGKALEQGAAAILQTLPQPLPLGRGVVTSSAGDSDSKTIYSPPSEGGVVDGLATLVSVSSTESAVGPVATAFYGHPSEKVQLVGVTGTNGKTTIATLLYNMFRKLGHKCGLLSTYATT